MKKLISFPREEIMDGVSMKAPKNSSLRRLRGAILLQIPLIPSSQCWDTVTPILTNLDLQQYQVDSFTGPRPIHAPTEGENTRNHLCFVSLKI